VNDDYLWNRKGRDREVEALEELLEPLGQRGRSSPPTQRTSRPRWGAVLAVLAAAAVIALMVRFWFVSDAPRSAAQPASVAHEIDLERYGTVQVHQGAVVELLQRNDEDIRLRLTRGTIDARITLAARPRLFQVETPATTCVDLGCHYTLTVEPDGSTFVKVDVGQVAFVEKGRETWIPSDASCRAWPAHGAGTPRWDDARPELVAAIETFDRSSAGERLAAATSLIALCGEPRDALSLWHLAHDPDQAIAEAAWPALTRLIGVPDGTGDPRAPQAQEDWKRRLRSARDAK